MSEKDAYYKIILWRLPIPREEDFKDELFKFINLLREAGYELLLDTETDQNHNDVIVIYVYGEK